MTGLLSEEQCKARDARRKSRSASVSNKSDEVGSPSSQASNEVNNNKDKSSAPGTPVTSSAGKGAAPIKRSKSSQFTLFS